METFRGLDKRPFGIDVTPIRRLELAARNMRYMSYARFARKSAKIAGVVISAMVLKKIYNKYIGMKTIRKWTSWGSGPKTYTASKSLVARSLRRISRLEKGISGREWKTHDVSSSTAVSTTGSVIPISAMAQGDTSLLREGLQVRMQTIAYRLTCTLNTSVSSTKIRFIVVMDKECHGVAPTVAELLEAGSPIEFKEHDQRGRFRFLSDKTYMINSQYSGQEFQIFKRWFKNLKGRKHWYIGTAGSTANLGKNALYLVMISDQATYTPTVAYRTRLRFTD